VTFSESDFGPEYNPGEGESSHDHDGNGGYALIVNGHSLVHALNPQLEQLFLELACQCKSYVIRLQVTGMVRNKALKIFFHVKVKL